MDWNKWQLFDLILLDKLQCSSSSLLLIICSLIPAGNHKMTPCSIFFLNCDLWLKDIIFLRNFWVFLEWMVWYPYLYHTISSVHLYPRWKNQFILNMKQLMNSDCCIYFCNLNCFLFFSVTLNQNFSNKWKDWVQMVLWMKKRWS